MAVHEDQLLDIEVARLETQQRAGHFNLRFAEPIEAVFRPWYRRFMRVHCIAALSTAIFLIALAVVINLVYPPPDPQARRLFLLLFGGLSIPGLAVALVYLARDARARWMQPLGALAVISMFTVALTMEWVYARAGLEYGYATLQFVLIYNFLLIGQRYFQAQLLAWLGFFAMLGMHWMLGLSGPALAVDAFNFLAVGMLAGTAGYLQEYVLRSHFLAGGIRKHQAHHDQLTGLLNRHGLGRQVERIWRQAQRERVPVAVAIFDIDFFKAYNDEVGHLAGDACLQAIARTLMERLEARPLDFVARFGGEEFAAVWFDADQTGGLRLAERFRRSVLDLAMPHPDAPLGRISISGGVTSVDPGQTAFDAALAEADRWLYRAKAEGRNRVRGQALAVASARAPAPLIDEPCGEGA